MIRQSWRTRLKAALEGKDVLAIVRDFLSEWPKDEIAALPPGAWPAAIGDRADLLGHAAKLAGLHARFERDGPALRALQEMLLFFTHAAVRMAKLDSMTEAADADPPRRRPNTVAARRRTSNGRSTRASRRR